MHHLVEELVRHYRDLLKQLTRELRNPDNAADIAQSSFERVYAHAVGAGGAARAGEGELQQIESPRALLFRVARNLCIDAARHRQVVDAWARDRTQVDAVATAPSSEYLVAQRQILERVVQTLEQLPPRRREVFVLHRAYGYTHAEIAVRLGITEMAVAKHLVRAAMDCSKPLAELRAQRVEPQEVSTRPSFTSALAEDH